MNSYLDEAEELFSRTTVGNTMRARPASDYVTQLSLDMGRLRDTTGFLHLDVAEAHHNTLSMLLARRTEKKIREPVQSLLTELFEVRGLGWSDIARLINVSVPAIRKWRTGRDITPRKLYSVGQLCAFLDLLEERDVSDPAMWIQTPLSPDLSQGLTKATVYSAGHAIELLAYAEYHLDLEGLLGLVNIDREQRTRTVTIEVNEDGSSSLVPIEASVET